MSHDLMLNYRGIIMKLSRTADTCRTLEWALGEEYGRCNDKADGDEGPEWSMFCSQLKCAYLVV